MIRTAVAISVLLSARAHTVGASPGASLEPIVVASSDGAFDAAVVEALAPAGMTVVVATDPPPDHLGDVNAESRAIAAREHATATVWLVFDQACAPPGDACHTPGATLVAYDRDVDRVLVRSLPFAAPLTPEQAAEAARTARTMLRALRVTPDVDLPPPSAVAAPAVRARAAARPIELQRDVVATPPVAPSLAPPPADTLAVAATLGGRAGAIGGSELAGAVAALWRPDAVGAAVIVGVAPSAHVASGALAGDVADDSLAAVARVAWHAGDRVVIAPVLGAALHRVALSGQLAGMPVAATRYDPAVRAGASVGVTRQGVAVGLDVSVDALLRRQSFDAGDAALIEVPRVQVAAGLWFLVRFL